MTPIYLLRNFSKAFKSFLVAFILILSVGYFTGLLFVAQTDSTHPNGVVENYNGNENDEDAVILKFKKGEREMLTILHTHILSIGFIFAFLGLLVWGTEIPLFWKKFLTIEPFVSILVTFGGIYVIWLGYPAMAYLVMISGFLMTLSYIGGVIAVLSALNKKPLTASSIKG
ncbi:MAG: hypothetical protein ACPG8F_08360 [Flavobacteriaceae bacterium]